MNWNNLNIIKNEAHSFEMLINHLASKYFRKNYSTLIDFIVVNGEGGDGGVESYALFSNGSKVGVQSKWFPDVIKKSQLNQIKKSINTALENHPELIKYIVCVPRNLGNKRKGTQKSEYENICNLFSQYSQIEIELWDDNKISEMIAESYNVGIYEFWFKNEYLSLKKFINSFNIQKESWLAKRYVPQLYVKGELSDSIDNFLGLKNKETNLESINKIICTTEKLNILILDLKHYCENNEINLSCNLEKEYKENKKFLSTLEDFKNNILLETNINGIVWNFKHLYDFREEIRNHIFREKIYHHVRLVEKEINYLINLLDDTIDRLINYHDYIVSRSMIIMGDGGTGKTCAIASKIEEIYQNKSSIPILIQGKKYSKNMEWHELISDTLLLGETIGHAELVNIFENITIILRKNNPNSNLLPKIVIFVDGCDEIEPYSLWHDMILKANKISCDYPFIKFVFTGRLYAFNEFDNEYSIKHFVTSDGDVSVDRLFDMYLEEYNIKIDDNSWLKSYIKTPFALKLFCDVNRNQTISTTNLKNENYIKLFQKKMESLEVKYNEIYTGSKIGHNTINKYIKVIYDCIFEEKNTVLDFKKRLQEDACPLDEFDNIIDYLCKEGFIEEHYTVDDSVFDTKKSYYYIGIQPYFDYLMASKWFNEKGEFIDNSSRDCSLGTMQIVSLHLIENTNQFLCDKVNHINAFDADCFALSHCTYYTAEKFYDRIYNNMAASPDMFRIIFNKVIVNVIDDIDNPIGIKLLDEFLLSFDRPIARDIYWSMPGNLYIRKGPKMQWENEVNISFIDESKTEYSFSEVIMLVWGLSNLNNDVRYKIRRIIFKWSKTNEEDFCKIFMKFISVNDNQIRMDLFSIAMSFVYEYDSSIGSRIIKIILDFYGDNFNLEADCSIRYFVDAIFNWGIDKSYITEEQKKEFYKEYDEKTIALNKDVILNCECPNYGYYGISYDLAKYVLIDPIYRSFIGYNNDSEEYKKIEEFLCTFEELASRKYRLDYFILSYTYSCLIQVGWDKNLIVGDYNVESVIQGIDGAIKSRYWPATHGSMSKIMTITEKYVWLIRNRLYTLFSSMFNVFNNNNCFSKVCSYLQLDRFPCPAQECYETEYCSISKYCEIISERFSKPINVEMNEYIDNIDIINFHEWKIKEFENNKSILSYLYIYQKDENIGLETLLWASSCIIEKKQIKLIKKILSENHNSFFNSFKEPTNIHCSPDVNCYVTPKELCWNRGINEMSETINVEGINFSPTVVYATSNDGVHGDEFFYIPSKKIRDILKIKNFNNGLFLDEKGEVKAQVINVGKGWETNEISLYIDENTINEYLEKNNLALCWFFRQKVSTTGRYEEEHKQDRHENDKVFVVLCDEKEDLQIEMTFDNSVEPNYVIDDYNNFLDCLKYDLEED